MTLCPSEERLEHLLADKLSTVEQHAVARHVDRCVRCQETLAHLTGIPDTDMWLRAEHPPEGSEDEEALVRRLKRMPATLASVRMPTPESPAVPVTHFVDPTPAPFVPERPDVPGYEIMRELGRGGMGIVYQARQLALQRSVALKMILVGAHAGAKDIARFAGEAKVIARLQHPNIVQIYDVGDAAGRPYFALEFVAGGSLAQHLDGTPQPAYRAAAMIETLARAVHVAHTSGVVHRDLKPANILLDLSNQQSASSPGSDLSRSEPNAESRWLTCASQDY